MRGLGIEMIPDLLKKANEISINFTDNAADFLLRTALGISKNRHEADPNNLKKTVNVSRSMLLNSKSEYERVLEEHVAEVAARLED